MGLRESILEAAITAFKEKGLKFTMDDIASLLRISKKTIYTIFKDKNALISEMADYCFQKIKESERKVLENETLTTVEKIRAILGVLPESYKEIDFRQLYPLKEKYPETYKKVETYLETGWEPTIHLLEQGMEEGSIRNVSIPVLKTMLEATIEQFIQRDVLIKSNITYTEALDNAVDILLNGIISKG